MGGRVDAAACRRERKVKREKGGKEVLPMFGKIGSFLPNIGKSIRRAVFNFCQTLAKSREICQTLAKVQKPCGEIRIS
jgi:hypothetical protein